MGRQRPGRSCGPASRGSAADKVLLSAAVMNPPPGLADQIKVQMVKEESQGRLVLLQDLGNEFAIHRLVAKQDFDGFGPRPIDFFLAHSFVAIAEVQANESNKLSQIALGSGLSQIRNRHESLPLIRRKHFRTRTIIDAHATQRFPYSLLGCHSTKMADSPRGFFVMSGTSASSAGNPTGSNRKGFSLAGRPRTWLRKPMGLGVWVSVASPML